MYREASAATGCSLAYLARTRWFLALCSISLSLSASASGGLQALREFVECQQKVRDEARHEPRHQAPEFLRHLKLEITIELFRKHENRKSLEARRDLSSPSTYPINHTTIITVNTQVANEHDVPGRDAQPAPMMGELR